MPITETALKFAKLTFRKWINIKLEVSVKTIFFKILTALQKIKWLIANGIAGR